MTDMKITGCVPLPGQGLAARKGDLVAVTEGTGPGPDPLLGALDEIAATTGDGGALVLAVARALLANPEQVSGACAGITASGEVAVLVHGSAVAAVAVDGGQEIEVTADGSMLPVHRTFAGSAVTIRLVLGALGDLDERLRLDGGIVHAAGLAVTASTDQAGPPRPKAAKAAVPRPPSAQPVAAQPAIAEPVAAEPVAAEPVAAEPAPQADEPDSGQPAGNPMQAVTIPPAVLLDQPVMAKEDKDKDNNAVDAKEEPYAPAGPDGDPGQASTEGWHPPTEFMPATPPASRGPEPRLHEPDPAADFEWVSLVPDGQDFSRDQPDVPPIPPEGAEPAMVEGILCVRNHFNDPDVAYCRQCGISMVQQTRTTQIGQRPPLGVLLLDDGTGFTLDRDYVLGREPVLDGDVAAGRARPLRISDPDGTVGRVHLRVSLVGWQVEVKDLGSVNGSVVHRPVGGEGKLNPYDPVVVEPGTRIGIGQRSVQYLSYRAG